MRDIGKNIKQLRQMKNMTQDELAEKLFVTRQTVSNYEIGRTRPDVEMLTKIAEILDVDIHVLLYGLPEPVRRKKEAIKTCVAVTVVILLFAANLYLGKAAKEYQGMTYDSSPLLWVTVALNPIVYFAAGWALLQTLGTFTKLVPISGTHTRVVRMSVFVGMGVYWLLTLPMAIAGGFPEWMPQWWYNAVLFLLGILPRYNQVTWYLLFAFLFGGLWWLFPWKVKK